MNGRTTSGALAWLLVGIGILLGGLFVARAAPGSVTAEASPS